LLHFQEIPPSMNEFIEVIQMMLVKALSVFRIQSHCMFPVSQEKMENSLT
jgi:hypothetical protein